ncbi:MAG: chloride channel protein [Azoarcus sp.]|jgi:H+/Cl- antiporter ClcA|nr:chloride channel protein [Azoarcus sp.]
MQSSSDVSPSESSRNETGLSHHPDHPVRVLFSPWNWRRRLLLIGAALIASTIAILFAIGADNAIGIHRAWVRERPWLTLIIAPFGFACLAWLSMRFFPGTEGSGIPQAIAASQSDDARLRGQFLSPRIAIAKVFLTLGGLLSGASIGREGPSVQIGASAMHMLADRRLASSRDLIAAGSGAGIAAAFNTPLGGIMFAIEEMCRNRAFHANSATLIAVILAGLMSLALLGNYTYFGHTPASLDWPSGIWAILFAGGLGGLAGGGFSRLLVASANGMPGRLGEFARFRPITFAAACGLATAILGLASGGLTYGTGYDESKTALEDITQLPLYFMFAKMAVIWLAFAARIPGGIFAPSLAVGAGLGAIIAWLLPNGQHEAILVLAMVGFLAAMTQSPITSFVIVMEMTDNHQMLIPLMATAVIAHGISKSILQPPLYLTLADPLLKKAQRHLRVLRAREKNGG